MWGYAGSRINVNNVNNIMLRSTFQQGPVVFVPAAGKPWALRLHRLLHFNVLSESCWVEAWQPRFSAVYPSKQGSADDDTLCGNCPVCVCRNRAEVFWDSSWDLSVSPAWPGSRGWRLRGCLALQSQETKLWRWEMPCLPPDLLAKLLQFCFLNMHRDLLVHKEKRQS